MSKTMKITLEAEGYATATTEWLVEDELVRPYAIVYNAWIAKGGIEISKAIYEAAIDQGVDTMESQLAPSMIRSVI